MAISFYSSSLTDNAAGRLLEVLDSMFSGHAYWSKYDDEANGMTANEAVYRCYDPYGVTHFYIYVKNNYTGYAEIECWESWDNVTHAGSGNRLYYGWSNTSYLLRIYYSASTWYACVTDFNFHLNFNNAHNFIGRPDYVVDPGRNMVVLLTRGTSTTEFDPFSYGYRAAANSYIVAKIWDMNNSEIGIFDGLEAYLLDQGAVYTSIDTVEFDPKTWISDQNRSIIGYIENGVSCWKWEKILVSGDTVTVNGQTWIYLYALGGDDHGSLMRIS